MYEDLGCHVLRCADEAEGSCLVLYHSFAGAHVNEFYVAVSTDHNILRLEVSVDDVFLVEDL
jgi:hypothetical protein